MVFDDAIEKLSKKKVIVLGKKRFVNDFTYVFSKLLNKEFKKLYLDDYLGEKLILPSRHFFSRSIASEIKKASKRNDVVIMCGIDFPKESITISNVFDMEDFIPLLDSIGSYSSVVGEKPSDMFRKTMNAPSLKKIPCVFPFETVSIGPSGGMASLCECPGVLRVGHLLDETLQNIWTSTYAVIYRLSMINQTYCFCLERSCRFDLYGARQCQDKVELDDKAYFTNEKNMPTDFRIAHSGTCNLRCKQCRENIQADNDSLFTENMLVSERLLTNLHYAKDITLAGNGEVFVSKPYKFILDHIESIGNKEIMWHFLSNGNLMTEEVLQNLVIKTNGNLDISVSIDAASKETYAITRTGGDWDKLMNNLRYASRLLQDGKIRGLTLNFVVQQQNIMEVADFVRLGNELNASIIHFTAIYNVGTFSEEEFQHIGILDQNGNIKEELQEFFKDPILNQENVFLPYNKNK